MPFDLDALADALGMLGQYASKRAIYFGDHTSLMASLPAHSIPADQIRADLQALKASDRIKVRAHFLGNAARMAKRAHLGSALQTIEQALDSAPESAEPPVILLMNAKRVPAGLPSGVRVNIPGPEGGWNRETLPGSDPWKEALGSIDMALEHPDVGTRPVHAMVMLPLSLALHFATRLEDRGQCFFWQHVREHPPMCVSPGYLGQTPGRDPILKLSKSSTTISGKPVALVVNITFPAVAREYEPSLASIAADMPQWQLSVSKTGPLALPGPDEAMRAARQIRETLERLANDGASEVHLIYVGPVAVLMEAGRNLRVLSVPVVVHERGVGDGGAVFRPAVRLTGMALSWFEAPTRPTELSIVFVAAQPHGAANINMGKELQLIRAELRSSIGRDRLKLGDIQTSAHTDVIQRILLEGAGNVLHFSGHGIEGALVLEQPDGSIFKLPNALFVGMIRLVNQQRARGAGHPPYRFVVLNACFSSTLARELVEAKVVEAAVGTTIAVPDSAAMAFAKRFYGALADGSPMNEAHQWGQMQVQLAGKGPEVGEAFELHVAAGVDAAELRV